MKKQLLQTVIYPEVTIEYKPSYLAKEKDGTSTPMVGGFELRTILRKQYGSVWYGWLISETQVWDSTQTKHSQIATAFQRLHRQVYLIQHLGLLTVEAVDGGGRTIQPVLKDQRKEEDRLIEVYKLKE